MEGLPGYEDLLRSLKVRIQSAQVRAAIAVTHELVLLYWQIGRDILERQRAQGWGTQVIDRLSGDLKVTFPGREGFSPRNLKYMRKLAEIWSQEAIVQAPLAQLPWYHHIALMDKLQAQDARLWYASQAVKHGWSRNILALQIDTGLINRQGQASTNFPGTLPPLQSDMAHQLLKDPYNLEFLTLKEAAKELDLERALIANMRDFLLELGTGFAFVGQQYRLQVGGDEFYTDLLFYHLKLHCYVVIDLKMTDFKPEYAGKMGFYVSVIDKTMRVLDKDGPTIGLILCRAKNNKVVDFALDAMHKPIGVATMMLPESTKQALALEEIKHHLAEIEVLSEGEEPMLLPSSSTTAKPKGSKKKTKKRS